MKLRLVLVFALLLFASPALAEIKLFSLDGQSNMRGNGDSQTLTYAQYTIPQNCEVWVKGVRLNTFLDAPKFGPEISLVHRLAVAYPDDTLIFVKFAICSTSLYAWDPDWSPETAAITDNVKQGDLYSRLLRYIVKAMDGRQVKFAASFWMQGERDAKYRIAARNYGPNFKRLILALRKDLGAFIPVIYGIIDPPIQDNRLYVHEVIQHQLMMHKRTVGVYPVSTHGLTKDGTLHYDGPGLLELGRRFADVYLAIK